MPQKCYDIPNILRSLAMDIACGKITMEEAACELNRCSYTPYVDADRTRKMLEPYIAEINERGDTK